MSSPSALTVNAAGIASTAVLGTVSASIAAPGCHAASASSMHADVVGHVRQRAGRRCAFRDLQRVHAVGHRQRDEADAEHRPHPVQAPAAQREHPHHQRGEQQVADRVGHLGDHRRCVARHRRQYRTHHDRRADRRDAQPGDDAVQPHPRRYAPLPQARKAHDRRRSSTGYSVSHIPSQIDGIGGLGRCSIHAAHSTLPRP